MEKLRIAVQKKGRLSEKSLGLIKDCGIDYISSNHQLIAPSTNFPLEFLFLRDDDIPGYVSDGVADIGIVGRNEVDEKGQKVDIIEDLGFAACRLSIAVPNSREYESIKDLEDQIIATSYPNILQKYLDEKNITAEIHEISGSVEIAPSIGLTDAICDLVSSGSTLKHNGLKEVEIIHKSSALMIGQMGMSPEKKEILNKLLIRIRAVQRAKKFKYILLNAPNDAIDKITALLPGVKSPTIMPLKEEGWSSIHSVVQEDEFWDIIEKLNEYGAQGILVAPIEKIVS
jgi:ATP phosphoribosyltransferase